MRWRCGNTVSAWCARDRGPRPRLADGLSGRGKQDRATGAATQRRCRQLHATVHEHQRLRAHRSRSSNSVAAARPIKTTTAMRQPAAPIPILARSHRAVLCAAAVSVRHRHLGRARQTRCGARARVRQPADPAALRLRKRHAVDHGRDLSRTWDHARAGYRVRLCRGVGRARLLGSFQRPDR